MSSEVAEGWQWLRERLTDEPAEREPFDGEIGIEWPAVPRPRLGTPWLARLAFRRRWPDHHHHRVHGACQRIRHHLG